MKPLSALALAGAMLALQATAANAQEAASLLQNNGCIGCHGATFKGTAFGPSLVGIEHRKTAALIAAAIAAPKPPMPKAPLTGAQVRAIVAYLSALDGSARPRVSFNPATPTGPAVLIVTFPGPPPKSVVAVPTMQMGSTSMSAPTVTLSATNDPHVFRGTIAFSMAGQWSVEVRYGGKRLVVPVSVASP